jgi:hypothetical protein
MIITKVPPLMATGVCLVLLLTYFAFSAFPEPRFITLMSVPGELEIVRHPAVADYSRMRARGKINSLPVYQPDLHANRQVDIRSCDLSSLNVEDRLVDLLQADFDSRTVWPSRLPSGFDPQLIMAAGQNPGLGTRSLHDDGITGKGVVIAIIDQSLLVDHREYIDRLRLYEEIHYYQDSSASMHGPAVASIAVGRNSGVAPGADLYFIAEWHGRITEDGSREYELSSLAESIDRIVEINETLPPERVIRVISVSLGINPRMTNYKLAAQSIEKASKAGIYTVYVGSDPFLGLGRDSIADPDSFESYAPGQFWSEYWVQNNGMLMVPMDSRCTASPTGITDYVFYRTGGMSWAVPWVAGLYALACQVRSDITPELFWEVAENTSRSVTININGRTETFGRIIDPVALVDAIR